MFWHYLIPVYWRWPSKSNPFSKLYRVNFHVKEILKKPHNICLAVWGRPLFLKCDFMKSCQWLCICDLSRWWGGALLSWSHLIWAGLATRWAGAKQDGAGEVTGTRGIQAPVHSAPIWNRGEQKSIIFTPVGQFLQNRSHSKEHKILHYLSSLKGIS